MYTFVKDLRYECADLLAKIFNLSLKLGALQEDWETVNTTSIFTKG